MVDKVLTHALVDTFIPATQHAEPARGRQSLCHLLIELLATRAEKQQRTRRLHCFDMRGELTCDHELGSRVAEGRCFHYRDLPWDEQQSIIPA
jgi:hypothetical protein